MKHVSELVNYGLQLDETGDCLRILLALIEIALEECDDEP